MILLTVNAFSQILFGFLFECFDLLMLTRELDESILDELRKGMCALVFIHRRIVLETGLQTSVIQLESKSLLSQLTCWISYTKYRSGRLSSILFDDDVDEVHRFVGNLVAFLAQGSENTEFYTGKLPVDERCLRLLGWGLIYVLPELKHPLDHVLRFFEAMCSNATACQKSALAVATLSSCLIYKIESRLSGSPHVYLSRLMFISKTVALRIFASQGCLLAAIDQELEKSFPRQLKDLALQELFYEMRT